MRISDWSSDVCSSDLVDLQGLGTHAQQRLLGLVAVGDHAAVEPVRRAGDVDGCLGDPAAGAALGGAQQVARLAQPGADVVDEAAQLGVGRNGVYHSRDPAETPVVPHPAATWAGAPKSVEYVRSDSVRIRRGGRLLINKQHK